MLENQRSDKLLALAQELWEAKKSNLPYGDLLSAIEEEISGIVRGKKNNLPAKIKEIESAFNFVGRKLGA